MRFTPALFICLAPLVAAATAGPALGQAAFFSSLEDVPLPPGFSERASGAAFDAGRGRLLLGFAIGPAEPLAVRDFYYATLPQLGWTPEDAADGTVSFVRGRERLQFLLTTSADGRLELDAILVARRASGALE